MNLESRKGVLSSQYHEVRVTKRSSKYRLFRRTDQVLKMIRTYKGQNLDCVLDVGTADAAMLDVLYKNVRIEFPVGLDLSLGLLKANTNSYLSLL